MCEYIDILDDAAKQRDPKKYESDKNMASCITDIIKTLKKYKIKDIDKVIHILTSVVIIPIQILEEDPTQRSIMMRQLSSKFMKDIMYTQIKDDMLKNTEVGNELDRLRTLASHSETFNCGSNRKNN